MNKFCFFFGLIVAFPCFHYPSYAQSTAASDSAFYQQSFDEVISLYKREVGTQSSLYKGKEFTEYNFLVTGHQFFDAEIWQTGSVLYDGMLYEEVRMKYDVVNEVVVVDHYQLAYPIKLESEKVQRFNLLGHTFVRLVQDTLHQSVPGTGFYDQLYNGKVVLLAKRIKTLEDEIDNRQIKYWFEEADQYFIEIKDQYFKVKRKGAVLKVLSDHKKELKKYIKRNQIRFGRGPENAMLKVIQYYDQLTGL